MSNVKKGYKKEKRCRDELIKEGWIIIFKSVRWRFGTIDFAKLFDVVAITDESPIWRFISVKHFGKSNYYLPHQEEIREFKRLHGLEYMDFELWLWDKPRWMGRGKNKIWHPGGWRKITINVKEMEKRGKNKACRIHKEI